MFFKMFYCTSTLLFILFFHNFPRTYAFNNISSPALCDLTSSKPVPYATPSPINVDSKNAIYIQTPSPLVLQNIVLSPLKVINTGYALEFYGYPFEERLAITFGGVLCGETYVFYKFRFYVSEDRNHSSYTQINGQGGPFGISIIYFNPKYKTFENSLNYRDGLVIIDFQIDLLPVENVLFYPVEILLKYFLRKPGQFVVLPAALVYVWLDRLPFLHGYYAFYGSYIDLETGKQYECAISILADRTVYGISERQFSNSFLQLENKKGGKLINRQPIRKLGERKIYKAYGLEGTYSV